MDKGRFEIEHFKCQQLYFSVSALCECHWVSITKSTTCKGQHSCGWSPLDETLNSVLGCVTLHKIHLGQVCLIVLDILFVKRVTMGHSATQKK